MDMEKLEVHLKQRTPGLMDATGRFAVLVPLVRYFVRLALRR